MSRKRLVRARQDGHENSFQQQAEQAAPGLVSEFIDFVLHNKKWWMIPIVVRCWSRADGFSYEQRGRRAPFIYTLF